MNNLFPSNVSNSKAAYERLIANSGTIFIKNEEDKKKEQSTRHTTYYSSVEIQSPSTTSSGLLWQQMLAYLTYEKPPTLPQNNPSENEPRQSITLSPENQALIQLLRSWRESDDQERIETWEYLKQALDEDRLSDRKLFP